MTGDVTGSARGLGKIAARGGVSTLVGQLVRAGVQAASLVVLARLLLPEDFGLVAMVAAVVRIGDVVRESGLANAAIQARRLSRAERDNLFWLNTALGGVTGALFFVLAPLVALAYDEPSLVEITRWLALTFLLNGIATQYGASIVRKMRFTAAALIEVVAQVAGFTIAVVVALLGGAYWALVGQNLTISLTICVGSAAVARWLPGLPRRRVSIRPLVSYGLHLLGSQLVEQACRAADTIVVGFREGPVAAGLYNRAFQLMALPMRQLTYPARKVALPVLSSLRDDDGLLWRFVERGQTILLYALAPLCMIAAALSGPLVEIVLGHAWSAAAPVFSVLLVAAVFETAHQSAIWVLLATDRTRSLLKFTLVTRPLQLLGIVAGSFFGMTGVAVGVATSAAVFWLLGLVWIRRSCAAPAWRLFRSGFRTVVTSALLGLGAFAASSLGIASGAWAALGLGTAGAGITLALAALVWPALRRDLQLLRHSRGLLRSPPV